MGRLIIPALAFFILAGSSVALAELKVGYVDSQVIIAKFKEAQDAKAKLEELYKSWEQEALNMEQQIKKKQEDLEAQSLVLSDKTKAERAQEIQNLILRYQQFQQEKLGPNGDLNKEQARLMQPIIDKIQNVINKIGEADGFDYIFDTVNSNIVYASKSQTNLTDRVLAELEKGAATATSTTTKKN